MMGRFLSRLATAGGILLLFGCSSLLSPRPDQSTFYVLTPVADASAPAGPVSSLVIGLGPIRMPEYLEREEIATRIATNELKYSPTERWAEPLDVNFRRVVEKDLAERLTSAQIVRFPWFGSTHIDYKVTIDVSRFEQAEKGNAELHVHWTIADGKTGAVLVARDATISRHAESAGAEGTVTALSEDVGELSDQIASAIRGVRRKT